MVISEHVCSTSLDMRKEKERMYSSLGVAKSVDARLLLEISKKDEIWFV